MLRFFFPVIVLILISCSGNKREKIPATILPEDKMTSILVDIHLLQSAITLNLVKASPGKNDTVMFYNIFENNNITQKQFEESLDFYKTRPTLLNEVYDSVLVVLSRKEAEEKGSKK